MSSTGDKGFQNYVRIAIQCSLFLPIAIYLSVLIHELAHGAVGLLLGGEFVGMYCSLFSRSSAFVVFPPDTSVFARVAMLSAGIVVSLLLGVLCLVCLFPHRARLVRRARSPEHFGARMFCLVLSGALCLNSTFYLLVGEFFGGEDVGKIAGLTSIPLSAFSLLGLAGSLVLSYVLFVALFRFIGWYLPVSSFAERLRASASALLIPMVFSALIVSLATGSISYFALSAVAVTILVSLVASVFIRFGAQRGQSDPAPRSSYVCGALGLACVLALWLGVFGAQPKSARGLVWSAPSEHEIQSCNVQVSIRDDMSSTVTFKMRPFSNKVDLLWRKIKSREPRSWDAYETFARNSVPDLLGTDDFSITEKKADDQTPFFVGDQTRGARVIVVEAKLAGQIENGNPHVLTSRFSPFPSSPLSTSPESSERMIRITDFWKADKEGYIDRLEIHFEEGVKLLDYRTIPQEKRTLLKRSGSNLTVENTDMNGPDAVICSFLSVVSVCHPLAHSFPLSVEEE